METKTEQVAHTTTKEKKGGTWKRFEAFFDKNYAYFFAPICVLFVYCFALWQYGVYPFGKKYTAASYDLFAQICPFIEHLFDVLKGKSTLTYSYSLMGGLDVTGTFLYFFISPFSFLFLLFGEGRVAYASAVVLACKLAAIAWCGSWFAKKLFRNIPEYLCLLVGVLYAYCGYTFVSNTYINWMDFLIWSPLAAGAFVRFVKTGKFWRFSLALAACIYTCFSIACFSMFTVFPALIAYALFCVKKEERNKFIAYLCLTFFVAILLALPVLLPALGSFTASARGGKLFENLWTGYVVVDGKPTSFFSNEGQISSFLSNYQESLYRKWTYIISDAAFLALTIVWFFRKGNKGFKRFMLVCGVFTLLPTVVDEAMNLMNMGSYMSYALRFGFLNALYFLGGACLCLEGVCFENDHAYDGTLLSARRLSWEKSEKSEKMQKEWGVSATKTVFPRIDWKNISWKAYAWTIATGVVGLFVFAFAIWFVQGDNYQTFLAFLTGDKGLKTSLDNLGRSFGWSTGALEMVLVPCVVVAVVVLVGALLVSKKKITPKWLSVLLVPILAAQVSFYNAQWVSGGRSTLQANIEHYTTLADAVNTFDDGYFRVKDYGNYDASKNTLSSSWTACAPLVGDTNAFSGFSSVMAKENFATFQLFGYNGNGKNSFHSSFNVSKLEYRDGNGNVTYYASEAFADSFMQYKYAFVPQSAVSRANESGYWKPVTTKNTEGEDVPLSSGKYTVYENTAIFPLAFRVSTTEGYAFVSPNVNARSYRKDNQRELYRYLSGAESLSGNGYVTDSMVKRLSESLWARSAQVEVGAGKIKAVVENAAAGESLLLSFVASEGYVVKVNGKKASLVENDLCFLQVALEEGRNEIVFEYESPHVAAAWVGVVGGLVGLIVVALVVRKTKIVEKCAPVLAWAGILLGVGLVAFFMLFPTGVALSKVVGLLRYWL